MKSASVKDIQRILLQIDGTGSLTQIISGGIDDYPGHPCVKVFRAFQRMQGLQPLVCSLPHNVQRILLILYIGLSNAVEFFFLGKHRLGETLFIHIDSSC